ncbi:hypothetical protein [Ursidibacter maritimus]|uniref:Uncharacterized protein n=4 Tax=Ursidibacter maritimus TaxID=1331689 RepID=A0ABS6S603_9PAST|nr:hypothetical protein [Ursidibacter maritimus]KAE9540216.1 hypothetical protein A1D26_00580 [Ursidibacter maritimus]MBV6530421.1 hypothetical protein [Ursidibacter maritimus]MBV6530971.1 hypothetical protein [Ursidibacter maritimus]MBV6536030.1 hypothetical protein [Ursidibacter maritimus]MBV6543543.1 hypothetical protein [Ursidibacter maritimus]
MALNKEKASYITKNIAELINTQDISLLHDASELLRVLKNKGDQRFVDIVNNIESKLNNNQTWTLAKQFPTVAEQGLQALRDWSAKADMQRERMAILQYYAEERENRDAREARNANLARNVVGGMGVSLGSANSFNSFGGGLYFDNNINTLMVRLSFLDREMRLDDLTPEFIDKRLYNDKGELTNDITRNDAITLLTAMETKGGFEEQDKSTVVANAANNILSQTRQGSNPAYEVGDNKKVVEVSGVSSQDEKQVIQQALGVDKPASQQATYFAVAVLDAAYHQNDAVVRSANNLEKKYLEQGIKKNRDEIMEEAKGAYQKTIDEVKRVHPNISDENAQAVASKQTHDTITKEQLRDKSKIASSIFGSNGDKPVVSKHLVQSLVDSMNKDGTIPFDCKDQIDSLLKTKDLNEFNKLTENLSSGEKQNVLHAMFLQNDDKTKKILMNSGYTEQQAVDFLKANNKDFNQQQEMNTESVDYGEGKVILNAVMQNSSLQNQAHQTNNDVSSFIANTKASKASKASNAEPIQELAPENKGKPDSQASLVSSIASVKKTPTFQMKKTKEEQDENIKKETESYFADKVEPNRTTDHSPRALNEKNTTASIEEQKLILRREELNMTQEEKMRMEQEKANNVNASKGIEV